MQRQLVWDAPLRVFHWLLAASLIGSWATAEAGFEWFEWHFRFGYLAIGLLLFRLVWGFVGPTHARFGRFVSGPSAVLRYLRAWRQPAGTPAYVGHNPAGAWAVLMMLTLVGVQAGSGLFITDDIFYAGPYNGAVSGKTAGQLAEIHHLNFTALQVIVALHIVAIAAYRWFRKEPLTAAMWHGHKLLEDRDQSIDSSRWGRAIVLAGIAGAAVWLLLALAPPPPVIGF